MQFIYSKGKIFSLIVNTSIGVMFLFACIFYSCEKIEPERVNLVYTGSVGNVNYYTYLCSGTILDVSKNGIEEHGFCYSTIQNPTVTNNKTEHGATNSTGIFTDNLTGLTAETKYYIRAYVQNRDVISYGNEQSFTTDKIPVIPTLNTNSVSVFSETSATVGGNITASGGDPVTERGIYYSRTPDAEITGIKFPMGNGDGYFSASLTGLSTGEIYYLKAYAINSIGTSYGDEVSFITIEIGSQFESGTVVHIFKSGDPEYIKEKTQGLIVAPNNLGTDIEWGCRGTIMSGADGSVIGTGKQNTIDIITGCSDLGIAAKLCNDLIISSFNDWYLPSIDELNILYNNRLIIGGFYDATFWSSTEFDIESAIGLNFDDGGQTTAKKSDTFAVRAIRSF